MEEIKGGYMQWTADEIENKKKIFHEDPTIPKLIKVHSLDNTIQIPIFEMSEINQLLEVRIKNHL